MLVDTVGQPAFTAVNNSVVVHVCVVVLPFYSLHIILQQSKVKNPAEANSTSNVENATIMARRLEKMLYYSSSCLVRVSTNIACTSRPNLIPFADSIVVVLAQYCWHIDSM